MILKLAPTDTINTINTQPIRIKQPSCVKGWGERKRLEIPDTHLQGTRSSDSRKANKLEITAWPRDHFGVRKGSLGRHGGATSFAWGVHRKLDESSNTLSLKERTGYQSTVMTEEVWRRPTVRKSTRAGGVECVQLQMGHIVGQ